MFGCLLSPMVTVMVAGLPRRPTGSGDSEKMYEQQRIRVPAPRIGPGALGISIVVAFAAGGLVFSLLAGNYPAAVPAAGPATAAAGQEASPVAEADGSPVPALPVAVPVTTAGPNVRTTARR